MIQIFIPVLCSNRLSQMTRTYDDIEAVTRLLEEKEKDLELTAHIGKDLLAENTRLKKQVEELENDVKITNEHCIQLKYELNTKCNLLAALTNDEAILNEEDGKFHYSYQNVYFCYRNYILLLLIYSKCHSYSAYRSA